MGQCRGEPAADALSGGVLHRVDRIFDDGAFLHFIHAVRIAGVINAVAEEFPAARHSIRHHFRVMLAQGDGQADRSGKAVLRHDVCHAPMADPVGMVAVAVSDHIGMRLCPRLALRIGGRINLVILKVARDPNRAGLAFGPSYFRPRVIGGKIIKAGIRRALLHQRASSQSITDWTGSTSAYLICRSVRLAK